MSIEFYEYVGSPTCLATKMLLEHLKIPFNSRIIALHADEQLKPEFLKINPAHVLPTIIDNGFVLWESRTINRYLVNQYAPGDNLYPNDPKKQAIVDRMLDFDLGSLYEYVTRWIFPVHFEKKPKDDEKEKAMSEKLKLFDHLLSKSQYAAGDNLTLADFSLLTSVSVVCATLHDLNQYPNIKSWMNRLESELPYYKELMEPHLTSLKTAFARSFPLK
ncbi:Glutathione S-transferase 1:-like isoform C [Dinothrombium tinctorium]|uniref:Glutathione S-transferase 1:-like isoform C n=1 Tax=Dinothrombium tinctorium TaxID=1965070 RepID=A0A443QKI3_9ACAR|nr:Glutathione S-transferase 1:-like isoform C [Dinothrombium tinctorium]